MNNKYVLNIFTFFIRLISIIVVSGYYSAIMLALSAIILVIIFLPVVILEFVIYRRSLREKARSVHSEDCSVQEADQVMAVVQTESQQEKE